MNQKTKIIYDATIIEEGLHTKIYRTGIFFVALNILKELSKKKDLEIIIFHNKDFYFFLKNYFKSIGLNNFAYCQNINSLNFIKEIKNYIKIKKRGIKNKLLRLVYMLANSLLSVTVKLLKILPAKKEIKNASVFLSPMYAVPDFIRQDENIKKFTIIHDAIPLIHPEFFPNTKNFWFTKMIQSLDASDYLFSVSKNTKKDFLKYNKKIDDKKISIMPLATSENFYVCNDKKLIDQTLKKYRVPTDKYIFSLCTLEPRKNSLATIKAFVAFAQNNKVDDLYLVLGGTSWGWFLPTIKEEIKGFKEVQNKIIFTGYIKDEDLAPLYSQAICFVYPSLYEGFGLPVLEAMKCGTPVITSNISSLSEVVGEAGILVNPKKISEIETAIKKLYFNSKLRDKLKNEGLKHSAKFNWKKTGDIIYDKIKKLA